MLKKILKTAFVLWFLLWAYPSYAQDTRVTYSGNQVSVFDGISSNTFAGTGHVYLFNVQSNSAISFYIGSTANLSLSYQVFLTGSSTIADFSNHQSSWTASPTYSIATGYVVSGAVQTVTILSTGQSQTIIPITSASQIAIVLSAASPTTTFVNMNVVFTPNGTIPISTIQGFVSNGGNTTAVNPVLVAGQQTGSSTQRTFSVDGSGGMLLSQFATPGDNLISSQYVLGLANSSVSAALITSPQSWGSTGRGIQRRNTDKFASVNATAAGNTVLRTPGAGQTFVVQCVGLDVTDNATQATAGTFTISLQDNTTPINGMSWTFFMPSAGLTVPSGDMYHEPLACFGNGFKSAGSDILNVNLSAALTAGTVTIRVYGMDQ